MQRDWGLFAGGLGIAVLSATFAVPPALVYGDTWGCDANPADDVAEFGGTPCDPDAFARWISEPFVVGFLVVSIALLLAALAVMRGASSRAPRSPRSPRARTTAARAAARAAAASGRTRARPPRR